MCDLKNKLIKERTNQRDQTIYALVFENGIPGCPHCSKPMARRDKVFENALCRCWWVGQNDAIYPLQVVVAATPQGEFDYRTEREESAKKARAEQEDRLMRCRLAFAAAEDNESKFKVINDLRNLWWTTGRRGKLMRRRVREAIVAGSDFENVMKAG